jgi:hypothetical protein
MSADDIERLEIRATRREAAWEVVTTDPTTGVVVKQLVPRDGRIGRGLEALAGHIDKQSR